MTTSSDKTITFGRWEASIYVRDNVVRLGSMPSYDGVGTNGRDLRAYSDFCLKVFEEMAKMQFLLDTAPE